MDALNRTAFLAVGMVSGYGLLAIFCVVFSFMYAPTLAALVGGVLCLGLAAALFGYGFVVRRKAYDKTHLWLMLDDETRPPAAVAQRLISDALVRNYRWFARTAALLAGVFLAASLTLNMLGVEASVTPPQPKVRKFPIPAILALPEDQADWRHRMVP